MRLAGMKMLLACGVVLAAAGSAVAGLWAVIDSLEPGTGAAEAVALSADGSVIVGSSGTSTGQQAFRWTLATGTVALPRPTGLSWTWATDVSADGSYVAGYGGNSFGTRAGWEGVRWNMGDLNNPDRMAVSNSGVWGAGISGDGSVVVGTVQGVAAGDNENAFRWTAATGLVTLSHTAYPDPVRTSARAISADGQVVVGDVITVGETPIRDAFRWTASGGMTGLGGFTANAVSRDGSVIVGSIVGEHGFEACRWTEAGGLELLGYYAEGYTTNALGVSGDGSRVVGYVESQSTDLRQAFFWSPATGMVLLQDLLHQRYGFELTDWTLTKAYAISDDGKTIVGRGYSPEGTDEAWRAILAPEPGTTTLLVLSGLCWLGYAYHRAKKRAKRDL